MLLSRAGHEIYAGRRMCANSLPLAQVLHAKCQYALLATLRPQVLHLLGALI